MELPPSQYQSFDPDLAEIYGADCAVMIRYFQGWIKINQDAKINFREGKTWLCKSIKNISENFPYWTEKAVQRILHRLTKGIKRKSKKTKLDFEPVLIKKNFNKTPFDRTAWYAFADSKFLNKVNDI